MDTQRGIILTNRHVVTPGALLILTTACSKVAETARSFWPGSISASKTFCHKGEAVRAGPVTAEAVFLNHEELSVRVLYRDPVHDFAFVRCDLSALKVRVHSPGQQRCFQRAMRHALVL